MRGPLKGIAAAAIALAVVVVTGCGASSSACHSIKRPHIHAAHDILLLGRWPATTFEVFALDAPDPNRLDAPRPTMPPG